MKKNEVKRFFVDNYKWLTVVLVLLIICVFSFVTVVILDRTFLHNGQGDPIAEDNNTQGENQDTDGDNVVGLSGNGTVQDPFLIQNEQDLLEFSQNVDRYCFVNGTNAEVNLTADIDLGGMDWYPIGSKQREGLFFSGNFNGGGHTISNCNIVGEGYDYVGFFSHIWEIEGKPATIRDLNLDDISIHSTEEHFAVGGLIGASGANIVNCNINSNIDLKGDCSAFSGVGGVAGLMFATISNCTSSGSMSVLVNEDSQNAYEPTYPKYGGLVGRVQSTGKAHDLINNMELNFSLLSTTEQATNVVTCTVGGVLGLVQANGVTYSNLINNANINGVGSVGGVVGDYYCDTATITDCVNNGNIFTTSGESLNVGGIVGYSFHTTQAQISNCLNIGNIEVDAIEYNNRIVLAWGGGILGVGTTTITNCKSTGNLNFHGDTTMYVGGLVGGNNGIVKNSYCTGNVQVESSVGLIVGGLVGVLQENIGVTLESCYCIGNTTATINGVQENVGGIVGLNMRSNNTTIKNNYYNQDAYLTTTNWCAKYDELTQVEGTLISNNASLDTTTLKNSTPNGFIEYQQDATNPNAVWIMEQNKYPKLYWEQ